MALKCKTPVFPPGRALACKTVSDGTANFLETKV